MWDLRVQKRLFWLHEFLVDELIGYHFGVFCFIFLWSLLFRHSFISHPLSFPPFSCTSLLRLQFRSVLHTHELISVLLVMVLFWHLHWWLEKYYRAVVRLENVLLLILVLQHNAHVLLHPPYDKWLLISAGRKSGAFFPVGEGEEEADKKRILAYSFLQYDDAEPRCISKRGVFLS